MMDMGTDRYIPKAKLRARIAEGGDHHHYVVEGGIWWIHTQLAIAKRTGDTTRLKRLEREKEKHDAKIMKDVGKTIRR